MGLLWVALAACGTAMAQQHGAAQRAYAVVFAGGLDADLENLLRAASRLVALRDSPPLSEPALEQRIASDRARLSTVLESEGYYDGAVSVSIDDSDGRRTLHIAVNTGPRYRIGRWGVDGLTDAQRQAIARTTPLPVAAGVPARAPAVLDTGETLVRRLTEEGFPFAAAEQPEIRIDREAKTLDVVYRLKPGEAARFGPLTIRGNTTVREDYLRLLAPWDRGNPYDQRRIERYHERLAGTGLFRSVRVEHAPAAAADGSLPVTVTLEPAAPRSIGAGANFSSDEGLGIDLGWEHRNLFGRQERFAIDLRATELRQRLSFDLRKPNFGRLDKDLVLDLTAKRQNSDAFDEESLAATAILERRINPRWRYSYGGSVELSQIEEDTRDTTNTLFGGPLRLNYDGTDDLLDPTSGRRLGLSLTPYIGTFSRNVTFGVAEAAGSSYLAVPDERLVFAGRFRIGSAIGERTSQIPANKRFYAGGGGSVRGYELESLGLLDADGDPLGGRSVLELGLESRIRVNEDIGIVPFLEGGNVFDDPVPNGTGTLRWAAGIGLRYFTLVGPLRFDIAVPLDERPSDDDYQIYISIGQAF